MIEMRAKGEKFTLEELGLLRPARTNEAMEVIELAASRFKALERAQIFIPFHSSEDLGSATKRVAWAETNLHGMKGQVYEWESLAKELESLRPMLVTLRKVLHNPPSDPGIDYTHFGRSLNIVALREVRNLFMTS